MKTSHILAVSAIVIIGLLFFFSDSTNQKSDSQTATSDIENVFAEPQAEEVIAQTEQDADSSEQVFTLDSFNYEYSQEEIRVKQGDTVTINLTNSEGYHDWVVDEFDVATAKINNGESASVTFVADKKGTFEYYCSVGIHRQMGMVGILIVE
jgi:plastocyanin